jgi:hypothetical protein
MANSLYPKWKEALLQATANSDLAGSGTTGVYVALVDTGTYTYNAAHQFYSELSGIAGTTDQEITATKTYTNGVFDGADITFPSVAVGNNCEALVIYRKNAGANTTWRLVAFLDTGITGMPVLPNGGNISVTWNASGIFGL